MTSALYTVAFDDGGSSVQCRGAASVLGFLRRGGCRVVVGDLTAIRKLEAEEHGRVQAALDECTWADEGVPCR